MQSVGRGETCQKVDLGCAAEEICQLATGGLGKGETRLQSLLEHCEQERLWLDLGDVGGEDRSPTDSEQSEESADSKLQLTEDCAEGDELVRSNRIRYLLTDCLDIHTKSGEVHTMQGQKLMSLSIGGYHLPKLVRVFAR